MIHLAQLFLLLSNFRFSFIYNAETFVDVQTFKVSFIVSGNAVLTHTHTYTHTNTLSITSFWHESTVCVLYECDTIYLWTHRNRERNVFKDIQQQWHWLAQTKTSGVCWIFCARHLLNTNRDAKQITASLSCLYNCI